MNKVISGILKACSNQLINGDSNLNRSKYSSYLVRESEVEELRDKLLNLN